MKIKYILFFAGLMYLILSIASAKDGGDFDVYLDAAEKLNNGKNIYAPPFIRDLQYYYSPLFALLLIPFSSSFFATELIWLLLSGLLLYRTWMLIRSYFNMDVFSNKEILLWTALSFFFILRFLLYNISLIQITVFLMWTILESIHLIRKGNPFLGAALLALAINIKIMPLVALPYLIYRGYFKASALLVFFALVYLFVPTIFIGFDFNNFLLNEWWAIINPLQGEHMIEAGINAQSLVGLIPVYLTETDGQMALDRNFVNLSIASTELITNLARLTLILLTFLFLKKPFNKMVDKLSEIKAIAYILLIVPLIFPHQQKYAFLFIFPMMIYLIYYCILRLKYSPSIGFKIFLGCLLLVSLMFTPLIGSDVIGRNLYDAIHHYRILGFSTLSLVLFSILAKVKHIHKIIEQNALME